MATKKKPAAAGAATPAPPAPAPAPTDEATEIKAASLKIKELVERVVAATGARKKGVKEIVEAALHELGEALGRGEELNLPGLGRTRVTKTAEKAGAAHLTLKLRRGPHRKRPAEDKETLADTGEAS